MALFIKMLNLNMFIWITYFISEFDIIIVQILDINTIKFAIIFCIFIKYCVYCT